MTDGGPNWDEPSEWERLDLRVVVAKVLRVLGPIVPIVVGLTVLGQRSGPDTFATFVMLGLGAVAVTIGDLLRWARTEFRVTNERVELRSGLLTRTHLTVPRERVRRVELTSSLMHRILGLSLVTVGTAERGTEGDTITLDAVTTQRAVALRHQLLTGAQSSAATGAPNLAAAPGTSGSPQTAGPDTGRAGTGSDSDSDSGQLLAGLRWRWAPYNVLSIATVIVPAATLGGLYQLTSAAGLELDPESLVERSDWLSGDRWPLLVALAVAGALLVGVVGSLLLFITTWWGYELRREHGDTLRMTRGLFTTRATTFDELRIRGVAVHESLAQRAAGGARILAIAHGLSGGETGTSDRRDALAPPCPRADVDHIARLVLRRESSPTAAPLVAHPVDARTRRIVGAAVDSAVTVIVGAAAAVGPGPAPPVTWLAVLVLCVGSFVVALASYRSLGHTITGPYLVTRSGVLVRRTIVLDCSGIIGWTIRQTWFQRRRGLADLVATTAVGTGAYVVEDVSLDDAARLAAAASGDRGAFPTSLAFVP